MKAVAVGIVVIATVFWWGTLAAVCQSPTSPPTKPCTNQPDCSRIIEQIQKENCRTGNCGASHRKKETSTPPANVPPATQQPVAPASPPAQTASSAGITLNIPPELLQGIIPIAREYADARKEDADTNARRLDTVEIPAEAAQSDLLKAQAEEIRALTPAKVKLVEAQAYLTNMQGGYLKHDHLWKLLYHGMDGTAFGMGLAYQNVAGINVQQTGGGAAISNSGNVTAKGGAGGAGGSSSSSATGGSATATGGNSSSSSSSSSKSKSSSNSSAAASAASNP